jgi:hypothetical protein
MAVLVAVVDLVASLDAVPIRYTNHCVTTSVSETVEILPPIISAVSELKQDGTSLGNIDKITFAVCALESTHILGCAFNCSKNTRVTVAVSYIDRASGDASVGPVVGCSVSLWGADKCTTNNQD